MLENIKVTAFTLSELLMENQQEGKITHSPGRLGLKVALINMVVIFMMSAKLATLCLFKIKIFWNKGYDLIIFVHDVTNKVLSRDSKLSCRCGHVTKVW